MVDVIQTVEGKQIPDGIWIAVCENSSPDTTATSIEAHSRGVTYLWPKGASPEDREITIAHAKAKAAERGLTRIYVIGKRVV